MCENNENVLSRKMEGSDNLIIKVLSLLRKLIYIMLVLCIQLYSTAGITNLFIAYLHLFIPFYAGRLKVLSYSYKVHHAAKNIKSKGEIEY